MHKIIDRLRSNHTAAILIGIAWVILWVAIIATWMYDEQGYSFGMQGALFFILLLSPFLIGIYYGYYERTIQESITRGALSGFLLSLLNFAMLLIWSGVLAALGKIDPTNSEFSLVGNILEIGEMLLLFAIVAVLTGAIGGMTGWAYQRLGKKR